jgi:UDP-glucose 4-epimerase
MGLKWLITGGCGFIGTNLIRKLIKQGRHTIRIVDNLSVGTKQALDDIGAYVETDLADVSAMVLQPAIELIVGDVQDSRLALSVCEGADIIIHLAANTGVGPSVENPRSDCLTNVIGTFNYLEAARNLNISRFVFASSGAPVGEISPPIHEEIAPHPVSPYGASKLAGEGYCSAYNRTFDVDTVALRFGNVYGPGSLHKSSLVAKFIQTVLKGDVFEIYGDGQQTRDFIYIEDLVEAVLLAAEKPGIGGEIFQIATNKETTVTEIVMQLERLLLDQGIDNNNVSYGDKRVGDVMRNYSDTSKAQRMLGWSASTDLQKGLSNTIDWFLS